MMESALDLMRHRNTEGLSKVGKQIIKGCPNAYVENGIVYDPCHLWFSDPDAGSWLGSANQTTNEKEK